MQEIRVWPADPATPADAMAAAGRAALIYAEPFEMRARAWR